MEELIHKIKEIVNRKEFLYEEFFMFINGIENIPIYAYSIKKDSIFFRTRININNKPFKNISELGFPPSNKVSDFERANRPSQSLLYLSDTMSTSISEMKFLQNLKAGESVKTTVTKWVVKEDFPIKIIPDFDNPKMNQLIDSIKNDVSSGQLEFLKTMNYFFRAQYNEENKFAYHITSAFCNSLLAESIRINKENYGTMFTSVQTGIGFNLALKPLVVLKNNIQVTEVTEYLFQKLGNHNTCELRKKITANEICKKTGEIFWN